MGNLNIEPRTIFCHDNLQILEGINNACIDLIYLDPPFNKKKIFSAPIGSSAEGAEFSDIFREEDIKDEWVDSIQYENHELYAYLSGVKAFSNSYNYCYLVYMAIRLIECHRILKDTGSVYLHCDPTMSHYLKIVLDCIFGENEFRNEIVWCYTGPGNVQKKFPSKHDVIFFYGKTPQTNFYRDAVRVRHKRQKVSAGATGMARGNRSIEEIREGEARSIQRGKVIEDWWDDIGSGSHIPKGERTRYPTQKPLALLERIIAASSAEGDIVLDPFCGCATTCIAAEKLGRQWVGVDISHKAYDLVRERLAKEVPADLIRAEPTFSTTPPTRNQQEAQEQGNVYVISNVAWAGEYKVGIAKNVQSRLNGYQTSDPRRGYKLEYEFQTPHFREIEKHIHTIFSNQHEWVQADLDDIIAAIESYAKNNI